MFFCIKSFPLLAKNYFYFYLMHYSVSSRVILYDLKMCLGSWFKIRKFLSFWEWTLNLFNLDSAPTQTAIKEPKLMNLKVIIGIGFGCVTAFVFFIFLILFLQRRNNRLKQVVKDEVTPLRYLEYSKTNIQLVAEN